MTPEDPRHGTGAGTTAHRRAGQTPCGPCMEAHRRNNIVRQLYPPKVPTLGSQRRVQALQALGHSRSRIAHEMGYADNGAIGYLMKPTTTTMLAVTAARIAEAYERLSMIVPTGPHADRARTWAKRHGYAPPLAWDDIDDPHEEPSGVRGREPKRSWVDPIVVNELLAGRTVDSTREEKVAAMTRWLAWGRSERSLCRIHGWKDGRYVPREEGAA